MTLLELQDVLGECINSIRSDMTGEESQAEMEKLWEELKRLKGV